MPRKRVYELCGIYALLPKLRREDGWRNERMKQIACIMPETPYCSNCEHGCPVPLDEEGNCTWECMYDGKEETEGEPN